MVMQLVGQLSLGYVWQVSRCPDFNLVWYVWCWTLYGTMAEQCGQIQKIEWDCKPKGG